MRVTKNSPLLRVSVAALRSVLAGCGGGGGGAAGGAAPVAPTPAQVAQVPVQRTDTSQNANGSQTLEADNFYDAGCTTPGQSFVWTATQTGAASTGPATLTTYAQSGNVVSYETSTVTLR